MPHSPIYALIFLFGSSVISGIFSSIQKLGATQTESYVKKQKGLARLFFVKSKREYLSFSLMFAKNFLLICYALSAFSFGIFWKSFFQNHLLINSLIVIFIGFFSDFLFRILSLIHPKGYFKITNHIVSFFLLILWPFSITLYKIINLFSPPIKETSSGRMKDKILEILHDSEFAPYFDSNDQKLILSVISFKERIAREVMVPRIDMFTLGADISVKEATKYFATEGYSRIPVYKENLDNIIGTLYYKDLLGIYSKFPLVEKELSTPIEQLLKPIVYTPETKKISTLLQEFRSKQIHMAIVVDEYGGTEGIVTIEDILEELVGEIADEYDIGEEALFTILPSGGWIVDAKMTILDIKEELGIEMPQSAEYDTIGGYIFHKAGSIPSKGWRLHQNNFDLEVISSSERSLEKIRITPHPSPF